MSMLGDTRAVGPVLQSAQDTGYKVVKRPGDRTGKMTFPLLSDHAKSLLFLFGSKVRSNRENKEVEEVWATQCLLTVFVVYLCKHQVHLSRAIGSEEP